MKVLLAVDGTKQAEYSAWLLAHLPHSEPLELSVITVIYKPQMHGTAKVLNWMEEFLEQEKKKMADAFLAVKRMFEGANATVQHIVADGHAGMKIVDTAKELQADLIVVGATGSPTIERMLLGSTSEFVATHAECSVLVIRTTGIEKREQGDLRVTIAYDGSEPCKRGIEALGVFNWKSHTKFDLLTIVTQPVSFTEVPVQFDSEETKRWAMSALQSESDAVSTMSSNIELHVIEALNAGEGIVEFAKSKESDIVLVGDTGRGLLGRFLMGSVSRYVLRHATASVWISRAKKS